MFKLRVDTLYMAFSSGGQEPPAHRPANHSISGHTDQYAPEGSSWTAGRIASQAVESNGPKLNCIANSWEMLHIGEDEDATSEEILLKQ